MHYPWWYVPYLTAPMLIAVISVLHVLVSHYAVGGGLFLAVEVGHAYRTRDRTYLDYLHRHARFFILLTVVFGAITGVGIWWTIGLSSPLATEVLSARSSSAGPPSGCSSWSKSPRPSSSTITGTGCPRRRTSSSAGSTPLAAWISLVLITGITAFMLNPGMWADRPEVADFWTAFFNPQFLPQTIARTGGALAVELAVRVPARLADHPRRPAAGHDRLAVGAAGPAGGRVDYGRRTGLVLFSARLGRGGAASRPPC